MNPSKLAAVIKALKDGGIEVQEINSGTNYISLNGITVEKAPEKAPDAHAKTDEELFALTQQILTLWRHL